MAKLFKDYAVNQTADTYSENYKGYTIRRDNDPEHVFYVLFQDDVRVTNPGSLASRYTNPQYLKNRIDIHLGIEPVSDKPTSKNEVVVDNWIIYKTGLGLWKVRYKDETKATPEQLLGQFSDGQYALDAIREWEKNNGKKKAAHSS